MSSIETKIIIQCDFDGTITEEEMGHILLDAFADGDWRQIWQEYVEGRISVGDCNKMMFALMKAEKQTLLDVVHGSDQVKIRLGFREFVDYCSQKGYRIVVVSNGLSFYIEAILGSLDLNHIEIYAAENHFSPDGMKVKYIGPDGNELEAGFKEAYTEMLGGNGYTIIYVGNGISDIYSARRASRVFATADLLERCRSEGLECTPFSDFFDVIKGMEKLGLG